MPTTLPPAPPGPSKLKDVKRDKTGSVVMDTRVLGHTFTATATAQSTTTNTTGITPERYIVEMPWSNPRGGGADVALIHNGTTVASVTNQAEGASGTLTASFDTPPATPQTLTGRFTWATAGTDQTTGLSTTTTNTGVSVTSNYAFTGQVASGVLPFTIANGSADVSLLQNGSVMTSITNQTGANTISYSLASETASPTLTARFNWNTVWSTVNSYATTATTNTGSTSVTISDPQVVTGTGNAVKMTAIFDANTDGDCYFSINGTAFWSTHITATTTTLSATTTGTFTSPSLTARMHMPTGTWIDISNRTYRLGTSKGSASPFTLRVKGFEGSCDLNVNQIRTKALG